MLDPDELLAQRFVDDRPGLNLMAVEDAALPMSWLLVDVLAQERKAFPLLEEFVLRSISAGLATDADIAQLLGLGANYVQSSTAELMRRDLVYRRPDRAGEFRMTLTPQGSSASTELSAVTPMNVQLPLAFDRLAWCLTAFRKRDLLTSRQVNEAGFRKLPSRAGEVTEADLTPAALNRVSSEREDDDGKVEILSLRRFAARARLFLPVKLLIYADPAADEVQVGVVIDDELSRTHELEINKLGGAEALGISVSPPEAPPLDELPEEAAASRAPANEVEPLRAAVITTREQEARNAEISEDANAAAAAARSQLAALPLRSISVHEHPGLLQEALRTARRRLLIIAPWVRRAVVDTDFLTNLERRLRASVKIQIAHGYGPDDTGSDESALRSLANLQSRFPDQFDLIRLVNSHAKILVWDDSWVLTSFNWLSFKGDPARTYRMEEGTLIRDPNLVEDAYVRYQELIRQDRVS